MIKTKIWLDTGEKVYMLYESDNIQNNYIFFQNVQKFKHSEGNFTNLDSVRIKVDKIYMITKAAV